MSWIEINRETFEAWLFAQPSERGFYYPEGRPDAKTGCLLCNFFRETRMEKVFVGAFALHTEFSVNTPKATTGPHNRIPDWAIMLTRVRPLTVANVQAAYIAAFGDPRLPDLCVTKPEPAPHPVQCSLETNSGEVAEAGPVNFR